MTLIQGHDSTMPRKKVIAIRGPRTPRQPIDEGPQIDFADAVKHKRFEEFVRDMQSGRWPSKRLHLTDTEGNGLRAIVRITGEVTYHCHYFAPKEVPSGVVLQEGDPVGGRPLQKIGSYPDTPVALVRERAAYITELAMRGYDFRWGLLSRALRDLDEKGLRWRP